MWYELRIGNYKAKVSPLKVKRKVYPAVDKDGKEVKTVYLDKSGDKTEFPKRAYQNSDGAMVSRAYRLINGKVLDKFSKTKEVSAYQEVDETEAYDLMAECYYVVDCEPLRKHLQDNRKALKFVYTSGNGYKCYEAILKPFSDKLLLVCGFGRLSKAIEEVEVGGETLVEEVARANPEELMAVA